MVKKIIFPVLAALIVIGTIIYFHKSDNETYRNIVPEDAKAVAELSAVDLLKEFDLTLNDVFKGITSGNDNSLGIDFTHPVYGFVSHEGYFGLTALVSSEEGIDGLLNDLNCKTEDSQGLKWAMNDNFILCHNKSIVLAYFAVSKAEQGALKAKMTDQMKGKHTASPLMKMLEKNAAPVAVSTTLDLIPKPYSNALSFAIPADVNPSDINVCIGLSANDKGLKADIDITSEKASVNKEIKDVTSMGRNIKGSLAEVFPDKQTLWVCANFKGEKMLELLRKIPTMRTWLLALNMCVDADMMIRAIDGDVSLSIPYINSGMNEEDTPFLVTAEVSNTDFLHNVNDWKQGIATDAGVRFHDFGGSRFGLTYGNKNYYFGVFDGKIYFSNQEKLAIVAGYESESPTRRSMLPEMKNSIFFVTYDCKPSTDAYNSFYGSFGMVRRYGVIMSFLDCINLSMNADNHITITFKTKKNPKDILNSVLKALL